MPRNSSQGQSQGYLNSRQEVYQQQMNTVPHTSSKSHEPKERQKYETDRKLLRDKPDQASSAMSQASAASGKHGLMLNQNNQMPNAMNYQTQPSTAKNNPYSKTGRILSSLGVQKQQVFGSTQTLNVGSSGKGRNKNVQSKPGNILKQTSTVSSSSSLGSKLGQHQIAQNQSNVYLKTLTRTQAGSTLSNKNGKDSNLGVRKTPGSSQSSTKAKKIKMATGASSGTTTGNTSKGGGHQLTNQKGKVKNFG